MASLLSDVNSLIEKGVGDISRLDHIRQTIENNKQLKITNNCMIQIENILMN